jgi:hypothetical protein
MKDTEQYRLELIIGNLRKENGALLEENARLRDPKADPKEKELYSIKPLEWVNEMGLSEVSRPFDFGDYASGPYYTIWKEAFGPTWYWSFSKTRVAEPVSSKEEAKQKCADHFNSKLKLCLNREL